MYKIINQLTNQEETFEYRDDLLSRLEIINERMKSNKITGTYRLYSLKNLILKYLLLESLISCWKILVRVLGRKKEVFFIF